MMRRKVSLILPGRLVGARGTLFNRVVLQRYPRLHVLLVTGLGKSFSDFLSSCGPRTLAVE